MRPDVRGTATKAIMSDGGVGFKPTADGERKRITVRGREVGDETRQINAAISARASGEVEELLGASDDE
jgi:small subunit ribosomal protein S6e